MAFPPRRVLLAARDGRFDARLFHSACNLATRMNAGLEVLVQAERDKPSDLLAGQLRELDATGIPSRITYSARLSAQEVIRYANTHECVACVAIDAPESWDAPATVWDKLACPLVVTAQQPAPLNS